MWPGQASTGQAISQVSASLSHSISTLSLEPLRASIGVFKWLSGRNRLTQRAETLTDRLAAVARIRISPARFVGYEGEGVLLTAHPTDYLDRTVQGVKFTWESSNTNKVEIDDMGRARFLQPGLALITCRAGLAEATARVLIRPGHKPRQTDSEWRADQSSLSGNAMPDNSTGRLGMANLLPSLVYKLSPTATAQGSWVNDLAYDELWSEPRNLVGSPRNRATEPTAVGSVLPEGSNFNWTVPLINLSGRGINTSLSLHYNSRVWSRRNNQLAYDAIAGWPAPGFSLGFGRIIVYDVSGGGSPSCKYLFVAPDGTRHYLGSGSWAGSGYASGGPYETTDGAHLVYTGNGRDGGNLHYPDGTTVTFTAVNNRLLPTTISDKSGNYIQIAYMPVVDELGNDTVFSPLALNYIIDTLGRRIEFQYDSSGKLISMTRPGFGGTILDPVTQTFAQFDYSTLSASTNFTGLTVERALTSPSTLKHIYFPATGTGYKPLYSQFGVIYSISMRRQMTSSSWPPGAVPAITDGVESSSVEFNYPISSQTALTDAPAFTQRTESAVNSPTAVYSYSTSTDSVAQTMTFTINRPDATAMILTRSTNGASAAMGLVVQSEIKIGSTSLGKSVLSYVNDGGGSPQVQSVISYDETNAPIKVDFDYDQYGNIKNKREYGYQLGGAWQVRRRTHYTYKTDSGYIAIYLRCLVTVIELFDALENTADSDDVLIAKSSYAYDNFVAMGGLENYGGPTSPPPGHTNYGPYGKVTGVTEWVDFAVPAPAVIQHLAKIDIFGNVVKAQVSCCQEKNLTITDATYWSQPQQETSGDPNGVNHTTSTDYDFNTSLAKSYKSAADLVTNFGYDAALSPSSVTLPTGAGSQTIMDYGTLSSSSTLIYDDGGVIKTVTSIAQYDGWGRVIQAVAPNNAQTNTAYDVMGRVISRTNPFTAGGSPAPSTTTQYDTANRAVITTLPDGNTLRTEYGGSNVTATDQVGRKIKQQRDGLGRLVKVTEQNSSGSLAQETNYSYDLLDNLTLVNQGNQTRAYKYDALGRRLYERIAEQSATINDGTGTFWSSKYTYTEFGALLTKQDARGVIITYGYDSLHRLISKSYNTVSGVTTAPSVTFVYDNDAGYGTSAIGQLVRVNVGSDYQERYTFDTNKRVSSVVQTLGSRTYTTGYQYNQTGQVTQLTYPSTRTVALGHDSIGRLTEIAGYLSSVSYNIAGQVTGLSLGNATTETYGYDSQRLQMISQTATKGGNTLLDLSYSYQAAAGKSGTGTSAGNAGQLMSVTGAINGMTESAAYTYDLQGRLVTSNQTSNSVTTQRRFAYDRWGNRTGVWDAVSGGTQIQSIALQQSGGAPTNRISNVNGVSYACDAAGNVTDDGAHSYTYDSENRLTSVDGGATAQYSYDHQNRRWKKVSGATSTHYVWQGSRVLAEHNASTGSALVDYVYNGSRMIARVEAGVTRYLLSDRLSVRLVLDASGNVLGRQAHLPFGEGFGGSGLQDKHRFTSYERGAESELDYAINRSYSPAIGRFLTVDPYRRSAIEDAPQSLNLYSYVRNDPVNLNDPVGLDINIIPGWVCRIYPWLCGDVNPNMPNPRNPELPGPEFSIATPPQKSKPKCNVRRTNDPDLLDAIAVVLGEGTPLYRMGQRTYRTNDRFDHPTGTETLGSDDFYKEAIAFVSVIANRANSGRFGGTRWRDVITPGQFHGLVNGRILREQYYNSEDGSPQCERLKIALDAVIVVGLFGPKNNFFYWVAVFNPGYRGGQFARPQGDDSRYADTDFRVDF